MLALTRKKNQAVTIGDDLEIKVVAIRRDQIDLLISGVQGGQTRYETLQ